MEDVEVSYRYPRGTIEVSSRNNTEDVQRDRRKYMKMMSGEPRIRSRTGRGGPQREREDTTETLINCLPAPANGVETEWVWRRSGGEAEDH